MNSDENRPLIEEITNIYLGIFQDNVESQGAISHQLEKIRAAVLETGSDADKAMYDRVLRLIRLHLPGVDEALCLSENERTSLEHHNLARTFEAVEDLQIIPDGRSPLRVMVSGIGRSGTTLIYQQVAKLLQLSFSNPEFHYEPYLWNIHSPTAKGNPFDISQLHQFGLFTHTETPLFFDGANPLHDQFIDHLYSNARNSDPAARTDAYLTKVIRGSGRLRSYLRRYPDLKIIACLRNPMDTINSSLGMFSFFGEEFHTDDRPRFRAELEARGADISSLDASSRSIEWYSAWWRSFTEETLAVAVDYPDNVFSFCYESFQKDSQRMLEALMDFIGVRNSGIFMGLNRAAGPTIKATSLTQHDISALAPNMAYYREAVLTTNLGKKEAEERTNIAISRYIGGNFSFPIAGADLGRKCSIQLRGMMLSDAGSPFLSLVRCPAHPISLPQLIEQHHDHDGPDPYKPVDDSKAIKIGKTFGAVVTCHNNGKTIVWALLSCLNQTLPFDEIIVVDDNSSDESVKLIKELEERYSCIKLVALTSNLGPSAARDLGVRNLTTDYFTQLDGDDLFWPTKNAAEAAAISRERSNIAFSDIMLVRRDRTVIQSTDAYARKNGAEIWRSLLSRTPQIPRDMTISRDLYFEVGGYDITLRLYEDWEFKLRLAASSRSWSRATGLAGTIYNRISPGLSGVGDGIHARMLSQIFLRALDDVPSGDHDYLEAFDAAMNRFGEFHVTKQSRRALEASLTKAKGNVQRLATFAKRRDMQSRASENSKYISVLDTFIAQSIQSTEYS